MKNIGIITICDYKNYGNRLQNYASQEVLKSLGCQVETIVNTLPKESNNSKSGFENRLNRIKTMSGKEIFKTVIAKISYMMNKKNIDRCRSQRINAFKVFTNENIRETHFTISKNNIPSNLWDEYDCATRC